MSSSNEDQQTITALIRTTRPVVPEQLQEHMPKGTVYRLEAIAPGYVIPTIVLGNCTNLDTIWDIYELTHEDPSFTGSKTPTLKLTAYSGCMFSDTYKEYASVTKDWHGGNLFDMFCAVLWPDHCSLKGHMVPTPKVRVKPSDVVGETLPLIARGIAEKSLITTLLDVKQEDGIAITIGSMAELSFKVDLKCLVGFYTVGKPGRFVDFLVSDPSLVPSTLEDLEGRPSVYKIERVPRIARVPFLQNQ